MVTLRVHYENLPVAVEKDIEGLIARHSDGIVLSY